MHIDTNSKFKAKFSDNCVTGFPNISAAKILGLLLTLVNPNISKKFKDSGVEMSFFWMIWYGIVPRGVF